MARKQTALATWFIVGRRLGWAATLALLAVFCVIANAKAYFGNSASGKQQQQGVWQSEAIPNTISDPSFVQHPSIAEKDSADENDSTTEEGGKKLPEAKRTASAKSKNLGSVKAPIRSFIADCLPAALKIDSVFSIEHYISSASLYSPFTATAAERCAHLCRMLR